MRRLCVELLQALDWTCFIGKDRSCRRTITRRHFLESVRKKVLEILYMMDPIEALVAGLHVERKE